MKKVIKTRKAPPPIGPYNQGILVNGTLYLSGQIAMDASSSQIVSSNITLETRKVMENLRGVLAAADMDFSNVVKTSIFLTNMRNFKVVNEVYSSYFENVEAAPARETVQVAALPKKVNVEISMIAVEHEVEEDSDESGLEDGDTIA